MKVDWSRIGSIRMSAGIVFRICDRRAFTREMTSIVFVPDCFWMTRLTEGRPSNRARERASSSPFSTQPMSLSMMGRPPMLATISCRNRPPTASAPSSAGPFPRAGFHAPPGISRFCAWSAALTWGTESPNASIREGLT